MSPLQRKIVFVAMLLMLAMIICPPWLRTSTRLVMRRDSLSEVSDGMAPSGYGLIFSPPSNANRIDTSRLLLQCFGVAVVCGGLFVLLKGKE